MIIIYYRDDAGKITRAHAPREGQTMADIAPLVVNYNAHAHETNGSTAVAAEVPDDSLEAYLFNLANQRKKWDREKVQDAIEALRAALDLVRDLEG